LAEQDKEEHMPIKDASYANLARYSNAEVRRLRHYLDIPADDLELLLKRPEQPKEGKGSKQIQA
jgi:hypothetical protein